jgi:hypothetical protein
MIAKHQELFPQHTEELGKSSTLFVIGQGKQLST